MPGDLPTPPEHLAALPGMDLVRRALEEARSAARGMGKEVGRGPISPNTRRNTARDSRRRWSGAGPDARDPQPLGRATRDLAATNGWSPHIAEGTVFAQWATVAGEQIPEHAQPPGLRDAGPSVPPESTARAPPWRRGGGGGGAYVGRGVFVRLVGEGGGPWGESGCFGDMRR